MVTNKANRRAKITPEWGLGYNGSMARSLPHSYLRAQLESHDPTNEIDIGAIKRLLDQGVEPNPSGRRELSAIEMVMNRNPINMEVLALLVERGANPLFGDRAAMSSAGAIASPRQLAALGELLATADREGRPLRGEDGRNFIHELAFRSALTLVNTLSNMVVAHIENWINEPRTDGDTPLHARWKRDMATLAALDETRAAVLPDLTESLWEVTTELIGAGADPKRLDGNGKSVAQLVVEQVMGGLEVTVDGRDTYSMLKQAYEEIQAQDQTVELDAKTGPARKTGSRMAGRI